ncbi:MAG: type I methionyl aminopeptidase [Planctomycetota bacterium]|nr:MAG: type I methionyl aminopeptidase [Planctomycetota bacterium]REJ97160.1 MAG: type I methionyl aminopeptidase [Planctomycetota bacterium]REK27969.1 MAG: type I methionyl aminopeptidase [Planctomycetota bacterium]REK48713.1 MAG: type I methionyl aminopeptidase [Planctomycetota bacterium]
MLTLRSDREIDRMRRPGLAVYYALQIARQMVAPGVTTGAINEAVADYYRQIGGEPLFLDYPHSSPGKPAFSGVICASVNEEVVHGIPGDRELVEGDVISVDTGVRIDGWCGDSAVTLPVGQTDPEVQRLLTVTEEVLQLAIKLMGEKELWSEVAAEMARHVNSAKFYVVENFVGHGIGREMHEKPQVPNFVSESLRRHEDFRLEPGLVIAVEPMVNMGTKRVVEMPDHWTQSAADSRPSAHFEHTIAVTESGVRVLTSAPSEAEKGQEDMPPDPFSLRGVGKS